MIKVILLDADGVVLAPRVGFFTDRLISDFGVSRDDAMRFVKEALKPSMLGMVQMRYVLPGYMEKWGINKSLEEMFEYWWTPESVLEERILEVVDEARSAGIKVYLATDQEENRGKYLLEKLEGRIDGAFMSYDLGLPKHDKAFFEKILSILSVDANEVMFWDDDQKNVDVAKELGIDARFYQDFEEFKVEIHKLL